MCGTHAKNHVSKYIFNRPTQIVKRGLCRSHEEPKTLRERKEGKKEMGG